MVWRVPHEDDLFRSDATRLAERVKIDARMRLAGTGLLAGSDRIEIGIESHAVPERVELVVVDVADDSQVQAAPP
jgi:hypothetical protein